MNKREKEEERERERKHPRGRCLSLLVDGRREERENERRDEGTALGGGRRDKQGFKERRKENKRE